MYTRTGWLFASESFLPLSTRFGGSLLSLSLSLSLVLINQPRVAEEVKDGLALAPGAFAKRSNTRNARIAGMRSTAPYFYTPNARTHAHAYETSLSFAKGCSWKVGPLVKFIAPRRRRSYVQHLATGSPAFLHASPPSWRFPPPRADPAPALFGIWPTIVVIPCGTFWDFAYRTHFCKSDKIACLYTI